MSRENILHRVRTALGRSSGQPAPAPPPARIPIPEMDREKRISTMLCRVEALAGKTRRAQRPEDARALVAQAIDHKTAVASNTPFLAECGITSLPGVQSGIVNRDELRARCAVADVGITGADYALADSGTLVMIASPSEARLISLLPPEHIAVVQSDRILTGLEELFTLISHPAEKTSSMVLITGPSRTADIEQILVRGVHGPGRLTVVVIG
jgi:L-lactate dehydrogenase complex protein LldG